MEKSPGSGTKEELSPMTCLDSVRAVPVISIPCMLCWPGFGRYSRGLRVCKQGHCRDRDDLRLQMRQAGVTFGRTERAENSWPRLTKELGIRPRDV
jgi:hypothetical protein